MLKEKRQHNTIEHSIQYKYNTIDSIFYMVLTFFRIPTDVRGTTTVLVIIFILKFVFYLRWLS